MSEVFIALLRGVNVGGHNKLPMKQLKAIVEDLGGRQVKTYIQSGNVVFGAAKELSAASLAEAIRQQAGISPPVVLRSVEEMRRVATANPYLEAGAEERELAVAFLAEQPSAAAIATLDVRRSPPDEFTVTGREIYLRYPNGLARSKLTNAYFDSRLATTSTVRNWRTTLKLLELGESIAV